MKKSLKYREVLPDARRVVVKVGSRVIVQKTGRPDTRCIRHLVKDLVALHRTGREVVLITSGAIGAGMEALGMTERPRAVPDLQMAAAVGQTRLMSRYDELFSKAGCKVGQILLTHTDFKHKVRHTNARRTMEKLLRSRVIPIINENDAVADEEIRADLSLGDNDYLAALVVKMIRADLLVLLTTVDGMRETGENGRSRRVPYLEQITRKTYSLVTDSCDGMTKGGMTSKLKAAHLAATAGASVVIANGRKPGTLQQIIEGEDAGTMILASGL